MKETFDFGRLVDLCQRTHEEFQRQVAHVANASLAARNWLFGWYIVEYEQEGTDRAEYGARTLARLSARLSKRHVPGVSETRLKLCRMFYISFKGIGPTASDNLGKVLLYGTSGIRPTLSDELDEVPPLPSKIVHDPITSEFMKAFRLGWSHYVELLTIDNVDERHFYEIEAAQNGWGVRELKRQIASSLYERLALSRDKDEIRRMAREGQVVEKAADLIKNSLDDELPTVGIVLCHRKNDSLVKLTLPENSHIFASKYQLYLPSKEELKHQLELAQAELEDSRG